jgi:hypothetical protein
MNPLYGTVHRTPYAANVRDFRSRAMFGSMEGEWRTHQLATGPVPVTAPCIHMPKTATIARRPALNKAKMMLLGFLEFRKE